MITNTVSKSVSTMTCHRRRVKDVLMHSTWKGGALVRVKVEMSGAEKVIKTYVVLEHEGAHEYEPDGTEEDDGGYDAHGLEHLPDATQVSTTLNRRKCKMVRVEEVGAVSGEW